jgi:hypothetical protein
MEIVIHTHNKNDMLKKHKVLWTLIAKKPFLIQTLYAVMGTYLLLFSALSEKKGGNFWNLNSSLGFSLILLSFYYLFHTFRQKSKYFSEIKQIIERFNRQTEGIDILITEKSVSYKDFETYYDLKWSNFKQYKFYKDYLFLLTGSTYASSIIINKNDMTTDKLNELLNFVSKRIPEKF